MADSAHTTNPPVRKCRIEGCDNNAPRQTVCDVHRWRFRKYGDYLYVPPVRQNTLSCKAEGCESPRRKYGYCKDHCDRFRRNGDPFGGRKSNGVIMQFMLESVSFSGSQCLLWPWKESRIKTGYARMSFYGRIMGAHRAMCILAHGEPPFPKAEAAHLCGNGHLGCVNPNHLRWATHQENLADAVKHGRLRNHRRVGNRKVSSQGS